MPIHPPSPPVTRFQGSKYKLLDWLWQHLREVPFDTCLDAFGGSGCVSHFLKARGKAVTFNDLLRSSCLTATALVENDCVRLTDADIDFVTHRHAEPYDDFIARTFEGIYFTADENRWLDVVAQNIPKLADGHKQALAYHAVFQSALAKRPYNLFHRRNLYMRLATVPRNFGNKTTWDRPFDAHFRQNVAEANAAVFPAAPCHVTQLNATEVSGEFDLVYIDPPYLNQRGVGVDYRGFYHFLEGLTDYGNWSSRIDYASKHRRLPPIRSPWMNRATIHDAFRQLFDRFRHSTLAVSYRSDGIPTPVELAALLREAKRDVAVYRLGRGYKYVLSTNAKSSEVLLVGRD